MDINSSNDRIIMGDELEGTWKEAVMDFKWRGRGKPWEQSLP
jgi:hypothetical protein